MTSLSPQTETETAAILRDAAGPLIIRGGGTRPVGRPIAGQVLETCGLSGVRLFEPGALTLVAAAGTPLADVENLVAEQGQRLPFEPPDLRAVLDTTGSPTLGGMVATNASGPRRIFTGACRDALIGVRFVDGTGTVVKSGGRVMKNVTGYDLVKLMAGAHGTLGVLTEVSLKLQPIPESEVTLVLPDLDLTTALAAMIAALATPWEVSGAAWLPDRRCLLRLEGFEPAVAGRADKLAVAMGPGDVIRLAGPDSAALWRRVRDVGPHQGQPGDVWRVICRPSDAAALVARAGADVAVLADWGGALLWLRVPPGTDLRARLGTHAGHATLCRADAPTRQRLAPFPQQDPAVAKLSRALKSRFDPRGVLNPGLME